MQDVSRPAFVYRFGVFEADLASGELLRQGLKVRLQAQPFQILALLLEKPGEVVTRDEICRKLWPPDTFVDFEQGLGTAIKKLRQALGDDAEAPRYIETLPKRGYRFIATVEKYARPTTPAAGRHSRWRWQIAAIAIGALLAATGALWLALREGNREAPVASVPLTTYPGIELSPSFSPDGAQVAFSWDGDQRNNFDIYVKPVGSGPALRLTNDPAEDRNPAWSPDGRSIVFHRMLPNNRAALIEIPSLGGPERPLAEISIPPSTPFEPFSSWYPDGKWLATTDVIEHLKSEPDEYAIFLISRETGDRHQLTHPPAGLIGDSSPAFSPDGKSLVFVRSIAHGVSDLYVLQISPQLAPRSEPKRLLSENKSIVRPVWTADGSRIIYGIEVSAGNLWQIPASGGKPERLRFGGEIGQTQTPAVSLRGNRLAYSRRVFDTNIWRVEIPHGGHQPSAPVPVITSTRLEWDARFSPDGKRIAFASDRSGGPEIWICDATGSNPVQLTSFHSAGLGSPRWSPDGRMLVFDSAAAGQWDIYTIPAAGGKLTRITTTPSNEHVPSWSKDGKNIYFASNRTGDFQVWKTPVAGGPSVQVTKNGGYSAFESADGLTIYYSKHSWGDHIGIWKAPSGGGQESLVVEPVHMRNFDVTSHGLYFVPRAPRPPFVLRFLNFGTESASDQFTLPQQLYSTFSVSADEKWLLYSAIDQEGSDLMLVENFR